MTHVVPRKAGGNAEIGRYFGVLAESDALDLEGAQYLRPAAMWE